MKIKYFKTREQANAAIQPWIDEHYPNRFQDARSITRMKLVEYTKGFAWQKGDSGPYLTVGDFK